MGHEDHFPFTGNMIPADSPYQGVAASLRQCDRRPGTDPNAKDVWNGGQSCHQCLDPLIGKQERVTAGHQDLVDFGCLGDPVDRRIELGFGNHRLGGIDIFYFPVALAIDADLRASQDRFENQDIGVSSGDTFDG